MVLTNGKGNVHATDEEGNTIIEAANGLGVVLDSNSNIIAVGDAERNVVLIDRESNFLATDEEGNTIVEDADGSGAVLTEMTIVIAGEVTQAMRLGRKGTKYKLFVTE